LGRGVGRGMGRGMGRVGKHNQEGVWEGGRIDSGKGQYMKSGKERF
tara:strand:- start:842 stop:979 length:138 start_codon:yes stop_codon:yes gene_type:complete